MAENSGRSSEAVTIVFIGDENVSGRCAEHNFDWVLQTEEAENCFLDGREAKSFE